MDFIPGLLMGITRVTISYPFETIKNNMQINKYNSSYEALCNIIKSNPLRLYRGSSLQYVFVPIDRSFQFYYCETFKNKYNNYFIGATSGILSSIYNIPLAFITSNIMTSEKNIKYILKNMNTNRSYYKGGSLELSRSIIAPTIYIGTYFNLREKYKNQAPYVYSLFGSLSNIMCWYITYPIDTIRVQYQISNEKKISNIVINRYKIYGIINFYKGISLVVMRSFPSSFIGMYVYEKTRNFLDLK